MSLKQLFNIETACKICVEHASLPRTIERKINGEHCSGCRVYVVDGEYRARVSDNCLLPVNERRAPSLTYPEKSPEVTFTKEANN